MVDLILPGSAYIWVGQINGHLFRATNDINEERSSYYAKLSRNDLI